MFTFEKCSQVCVEGLKQLLPNYYHTHCKGQEFDVEQAGSSYEVLVCECMRVTVDVK